MLQLLSVVSYSENILRSDSNLNLVLAFSSNNNPPFSLIRPITMDDAYTKARVAVLRPFLNDLSASISSVDCNDMLKKYYDNKELNNI